ncbi:hypothetical protein PACTADRAFT_44338 [Pachysolen tannophilus NRRL Y-2460]|uniref:Fe2OG dioxygenase domain-containing protein n=1 Tax=Pachysolen tannophilus NRRL Y-2460 TaxID=669874 RepID=A0A1E4TQK4_PACTA|nr:hypothetical protein PACTADRAFT_44338 [Pachysolen tannophilus NRRL Y-2460]
MGIRKVKEPEGNVPFRQLPIIDLTDLESEDYSKRKKVAEDVYKACTEVGFFYIKNHGISDELVKNVRKNADDFFKKVPIQEKLKIDRKNNEYFLGYAPYEALNEKEGKRPHSYESLLFGREAKYDKEFGKETGEKFDANNQWPPQDVLPEFKPCVSEYFSQMLTLSRKLIRIFALALNLDESFFDDKVTHPGSLLALNYYAAQVADNPDANTAIFPHTDHELFTILRQDDSVNSLEVVSGDGIWVPATPIPGTFVVNIGDALSIWTNNVFLSTLHRAINRSGTERYSIPFFFGADYEVVMKTLPSCITESRPKKYDNIVAGEHYLSKMSYAFKKSNK